MIEYMLDVQFSRTWREDLALSFTEHQPERSALALTQVPGVEHAAGYRALAAMPIT